MDCAAQADALARPASGRWLQRIICRIPGFGHRVARVRDQTGECAFCLYCGTVLRVPWPPIDQPW